MENRSTVRRKYEYRVLTAATICRRSCGTQSHCDGAAVAVAAALHNLRILAHAVTVRVVAGEFLTRPERQQNRLPHGLEPDDRLNEVRAGDGRS